MPVITPFGFLTVCGVAAIIAWVVVEVAKGFNGRSGKNAPAPDSEESRILRDVLKGLERMEERVSALETLLMEDAPRRMSDSLETHGEEWKGSGQ